MKNLKGIKICIEPEKVREYYETEKDRLAETMDIVAKSEFDDADKACFLFVTNENGEMFLSLESPDEIVDSWVKPSVEDIRSAIARLEEISNEYYSRKERESEENSMENRKVRVSFKALYDAGITNLRYGGYIDYYNEDGEREYYDLRRDEDGSLLYCDGDIFILKEERFYYEGCKETEMYCLVHAETQLPLYLIKKEYDIAVFENKEKPEKPIYSIEKLYVQNDMLKKIAIKAIQRCLGCESELAVYDGLEDYLKSLTGYSKSAIETLLEHSFDAIKQE